MFILSLSLLWYLPLCKEHESRREGGPKLIFKHDCFYGHFYTESILSYYLLTPWCRVLLEKLTGLQLVKKFPAFHGTRRFITAFTSVILESIISMYIPCCKCKY